MFDRSESSSSDAEARTAPARTSRLRPRARVHEWHLGVLVIAASGVIAILGAIGFGTAFVMALLGLWLVVKDWPDLTRSGRDSAGWRLGIHRRPLPLRPVRRLDDVPAWRRSRPPPWARRPDVGGDAERLVARTGARPPRAGLGDAKRACARRAGLGRAVLTAYYLYRRARARSPRSTLMLALAIFDVLKGLDYEAAALTLGCALLLWLSRSSFSGATTSPAPSGRRSRRCRCSRSRRSPLARGGRVRGAVERAGRRDRAGDVRSPSLAARAFRLPRRAGADRGSRSSSSRSWPS